MVRRQGGQAAGYSHVDCGASSPCRPHCDPWPETRAEILRGLRSLLQRFDTAAFGAPDDDDALDLDSATEDELLRAHDMELEDF